MLHRKLLFALLLGSPFVLSAQHCSLICNGDFDSLVVTTTTAIYPSDSTPCWETTEPDNMIEVWASGYAGVDSYSGAQFVELNAYEPATLFQNIALVHPAELSISFAHRGRGGVDTIGVSVGPVGGPYTELGRFGDGEEAWNYRTLSTPVSPAWGDEASVRFNSIYAGFGDPAVGNFLDAVTICLVFTEGIEERRSTRPLASYPMPTTGVLTVELPAAQGDLSLHDATGRTVMALAIGNKRLTTLDLQGLGAGTYLLRFVDATGAVSTGRVVKQ